MSLVQVIGIDLEAERPQQADAADAEHDLLLQPVGVVAAVQPVGQATILGVVLVEVGVEQQDGHAESQCRP